MKNGIVSDRTAEGSKPLTGDDTLFLSNLDDDPGEWRNLRHQFQAVAHELEPQASKWLADVSKNRSRLRFVIFLTTSYLPTRGGLECFRETVLQVGCADSQ